MHVDTELLSLCRLITFKDITTDWGVDYGAWKPGTCQGLFRGYQILR